MNGLAPMAFEDLPGRVFLDTNVVNLWLGFGEQIHEGLPLPCGTDARVAGDVEALRQIAFTGQRASWQLAVSPLTFLEVTATRSPERCGELSRWFWEVWHSWREILCADTVLPTFCEAEEMRLRLLSSPSISNLQDPNDRVLLCDAAVYGCDAFCTTDWSTILRHRGTLTAYPIPIVTPAEWWAQIRPWSAIWA